MITLEELNRVYYADKEIQLTAEKIRKLESAARKITQAYSSAPSSASTCGDKLGKIVAKIADEKNRLKEQLESEAEEVIKLNSFISQIPDCQTRLIFSSRFILCLPWEQVADKLGGYNTADSVKKICYRYIRAFNLQSSETNDKKTPL